jgi:hypothetical protein
MTSALSLLADIRAALSLPTLPSEGESSGEPEPPENKGPPQTSHPPHPEIGHSGTGDTTQQQKTESRTGSALGVSRVESPFQMGRVGRVGNPTQSAALRLPTGAEGGGESGEFQQNRHFRLANPVEALPEPVNWPSWFASAVDERVRYRGLSSEEATSRTYGEALNLWHALHGRPGAPGVCAGCGKGLVANPITELPDGARIHAGPRFVDCLAEHGRRWLTAAAEALAALGVHPPLDHQSGEP